MNTTNSKLSLVVAFFVLALFCLVSPSSCAANLEYTISRICNKTLNPKFCSKTLFKNLKSPTTSLPDLTRTTVHVALNFAQYVVTTIQTLGANIVRNPAIRQSYQRGEFAYDEIIINLQKAESFARNNRFNEMLGPIFACAKPLAVSESIFGTVIEPLGDANKLMKVLLSMVVYEKAELH